MLKYNLTTVKVPYIRPSFLFWIQSHMIMIMISTVPAIKHASNSSEYLKHHQHESHPTFLYFFIYILLLFFSPSSGPPPSSFLTTRWARPKPTRQRPSSLRCPLFPSHKPTTRIPSCTPMAPQSRIFMWMRMKTNHCPGRRSSCFAMLSWWSQLPSLPFSRLLIR